MEPTTSPSLSPSEAPSDEPTGSPSLSPTKTPTKSPSEAPSYEPTATLTKKPTTAPTEAPIAGGGEVPDGGCSCEANDASIGSWKCGNDIWICPGMTEICKNTGNHNSKYYEITQTQCDAMKEVEIGDSCVQLPQYGITSNQGIGLSHRVCYDGTNNPVKDGCVECNGFKVPDWEPKPPLDCDTLGGLGAGFSEATDYDGCYPHITSIDTNNFPGQDDSVAVFVGGDYIGNVGAEVEGLIVTLGDLTVGSSGPSNMVSVGLGSQVIPNVGTDCIIVGGKIETHRNVQIYNYAPWMHCDIVHKGAAVNPNGLKTQGSIRHEPNYDFSFYENMMSVWEKKAQYWKTLPSTVTGNVYKQWSTTYFTCTDEDEIQVFNIHPSDYDVISTTGYIFSNNCMGKSILVNVHGSGEISFNAAAMIWVNDAGTNQQGYGANGFPTCMTESMMWNFPDASSVDIGGSCCTSEFHGSLLITGDMKMKTSGQSGRTIVLGDITHEHGGSEFHSYQYNPPIALPDPDDICVFPEVGASASAAAYAGSTEADPTAHPTNAPTNHPTNEPTNAAGECVHIPQADLPQGSWATTDQKCRRCHPSQGKTWWPCNRSPRLCKGNCIFH